MAKKRKHRSKKRKRVKSKRQRGADYSTTNSTLRTVVGAGVVTKTAGTFFGR